MKPRFSYANIVSTLALALALGGGVAVAADELAKNSVGTKQLKNNAVVGKKVKDGSLLAVDFGAGQLPAGPVGPIGPQGPRGLQGVPGSPGSPGAPGADAAAYFSYYNDSGNMAAWTCYNLNLTHSIFKVGDTVLLAPNYGGGVPNYFQVSAGRSVANGAVPITVCNMSPNPVGASTFRVDIWRVVGPSGSRPAPQVRVEGDR